MNDSYDWTEDSDYIIPEENIEGLIEASGKLETIHKKGRGDEMDKDEIPENAIFVDHNKKIKVEVTYTTTRKQEWKMRFWTAKQLLILAVLIALGKRDE